MQGTTVQIGPDLYVHGGSVQSGILLDGSGRALLLDAGGPGVADAVRALGATPDRVLCTHHHADQVWGVPGVPAVVPEAERALFERPETFWNDRTQRWHLYHFRPQPLVLARGLPVAGTCRGGDVIRWGEALVHVVDTPGHTDGSVSFVVERGGRRWAFLGDCISGPGQVWDLFSLQQASRGVRDYHGFLGARETLLQGLRRILEVRPEALIPSHGAPIPDPPAAVAALARNLEALWASYGRVSALRHFHPAVFADLQGRVQNLPPVRAEDPPPFVDHEATTYVLRSGDGAAFVLDCGYPRVIERLRGAAVEGLWISHYHDDHVDAAAAFREAFGCPVLADARLAEVLADPSRFRLPCQCPTPVPVDRRLADGERWRWHEFDLTSFRFPGQTRYHGALLVEGRGRRLLFAGDAFTPTGMDDYCTFNRNPIRGGAGYAACLDRLRALGAVTVFHCHVERGFVFEPHHLDFMAEALAERRGLLRRLLPWPAPDFGLDPDWVRVDPYEQPAAAGCRVGFGVRVENHGPAPVDIRLEPQGPGEGWRVSPPGAAASVAAGAEACLRFEIAVAPDAARGRHAVAVRVLFGNRDLGPFRAGVVDVA